MIKQPKESNTSTTPKREQIRELLNQAFNMHRSDPQEGFRIAEQGKVLAEEYGGKGEQAEAYYTLSCCLDTLSDYDRALDYADKALILYREIGDKEGEGKVLNTKGISYQNNATLAEALVSFSAARDIYEELGNAIRLATAWNNIGGIHDSLGNYEPALEAYLKGLQIYEEEGEEEYGAMVQYNIGSIYYHLGREFSDYDKALDYFKRSEKTLERLESEYSLALSLNGVASVYIAREEYDAAREILSRVSEIFEKIGELRLQATILLEIGIIDEKQKKYSSALQRFQQAASTLQSLHVLHDYGTAQYHIGNLYFNQEKYGEAIEALNEGLRALEKTSVVKMEKEIRWVLALAHRELGNLEETVKQMVRHSELMTEQFSGERQDSIARMQVRFDVEHAEREREFFRLRAEYMEELARQRSKELSTTAMHVVAKNTLLQNLRNNLRSLIDQSEGKARLLSKRILTQVEESLRSNDDWQRFEEMYQLVHHDFVRELSEKYSELSGTELKICALMHINLSNKEIAELLCVSGRTVESHRYRIRKKLGLSSETNLAGYLAGL
ncbi:MAG: tetratricopeptide repeat protein [Ignavibacteriae bacterium]|nr:tetratricopeptide repeat protein [Ignavibacteriota bacterium]MCB9214909.1 tetratricopeptide repeat protein [Ignavibacteria bacterium]